MLAGARVDAPGATKLAAVSASSTANDARPITVTRPLTACCSRFDVGAGSGGSVRQCAAFSFGPASGGGSCTRLVVDLKPPQAAHDESSRMGSTS